MPRIRTLNIHLERRRYLRRASTRPEMELWEYLRGNRFQGLKFRRQYSVGNFVLDFYCPKLRLGIELDGAGHNLPAQRQHDDFRTAWLGSMYIRIVRFRNEDVMGDIEGVLKRLADFSTAPNPSSCKEGNPSKHLYSES